METKENLVRRCCVCKTVILDGEKVPQQNYDINELMKHNDFTDTFLSYDCFEKQYGKEYADKMEKMTPFENKSCFS